MTLAAPDLTNLAPVDAWAYWGATEEAGLAALRAAMGASYATDPSDGALLAALEIAVETMEAATGRWFLARAGTLHLDGTGSHRLFLPYPVVSASQLEGGGVTAITIGDDATELDATSYIVNDGIGLSGRDPRDHPFIDRVTPDGMTSRPFGWNAERWPYGMRNVHVTATWGYCDAVGGVPALALRLLSGLTVRALAAWDDVDAQADLHVGAIAAESTRDRSITYGPRAGGGGITTDRELDLLIARLRAPRRVAVPLSPGRRRRSSSGALMGKFHE